MTHDDHDPTSAVPEPPNQPASPVADSAFEPPLTVPSSRDNPVGNPPIVPADLRVPWGWIDLLLLISAAAVGTVVIELFLVAVLALLGISPAHLREPSGQSMVAEIAAQVVLDLALLGYLALQIRVWYHLPFWPTIGWRRMEAGKVPAAIAYLGLGFGGIILVGLVSFASSAFPPAHAMPIETVFQYRPAILMYMFAAVFVAPLVEETVFRGYLYPVLARSFGLAAGIAITGTLFGLLHAVQLWGGWWQIALLIFVGVVLTAVRAAAGTVAASYLVHLVYNSVQVIVFLVATQGGRHIP